MKTPHLDALITAKNAAIEYIRTYISTNGTIEADQIEEKYQILYFNHHGEPCNEIIESVALDSDSRIDIMTDSGYWVSEDDMTINDVGTILYILQTIGEQSEQSSPQTPPQNE